MHSAVFPQVRHRSAAVPRYPVAAAASAFAPAREPSIAEAHRSLSTSRYVAAATDAHTQDAQRSEARGLRARSHRVGVCQSYRDWAFAAALLADPGGGVAMLIAAPFLIWSFGLSVAGWSSGFSANRLVG